MLVASAYEKQSPKLTFVACLPLSRVREAPRASNASSPSNSIQLHPHHAVLTTSLFVARILSQPS